MITYFELRLSKFLGYCLGTCRKINPMFNDAVFTYEDFVEGNIENNFHKLFIGCKGGYNKFRQSLEELVSL